MRLPITGSKERKSGTLNQHEEKEMILVVTRMRRITSDTYEVSVIMYKDGCESVLEHSTFQGQGAEQRAQEFMNKMEDKYAVYQTQ